MDTVVINKNINSFKNHLQSENFYMEENKNSDGSSFFSTEQRTENGANIRIVVAFSNEYPSVDIYAFNIAEVKDPLKKESVLKLLNNLNLNYRYTKFTIDDNDSITLSSALDFTETNFDPSLILRHIFMIYNGANDEFKSFMKLI